MAGLRDLDSGKIYIGPEEPKKLDKSLDTKNGDKPYDGTLAVTGPVFMGAHSGDGRATLNVGTGLGDFIPKVVTRAIDTEGDLSVQGKFVHVGDTVETGNTDKTGDYNASGAITISGKVTCGSLSSGLPKFFDIPHPNLKDMRLRHACPEGPESAIYVRGKVSVDGIIELPDYWQNFVDKETISVHLTPMGAYQELFVERIEYGKRVYVKNQAGGKIDAYYQVWANRGDCSFEVEYKEEVKADDDHWFTSDT